MSTALGWQLDDHESFDTVLAARHPARCSRHGGHGRGGGAARRGTSGAFSGPNGLTQEIFTRPPRRQPAPGHGSPGRLRDRRIRHGPCAPITKDPQQVHGYFNSRVRRAPVGLHRRDHQRAEVQDPLPAGQRAPPFGRYRQRCSGSSQPDSHPGAAPQHPGRPRSTTCLRPTSGSANSASTWRGRRPAHQRQGSCPSTA